MSVVQLYNKEYTSSEQKVTYYQTDDFCLNESRTGRIPPLKWYIYDFEECNCTVLKVNIYISIIAVCYRGFILDVSRTLSSFLNLDIWKKSLLVFSLILTKLPFSDYSCSNLLFTFLYIEYMNYGFLFQISRLYLVPKVFSYEASQY